MVIKQFCTLTVQCIYRSFCTASEMNTHINHVLIITCADIALVQELLCMAIHLSQNLKENKQ